MVELMGWAIAGVLVLITVATHYEIIRLASDIILPWAMRNFHDRRVMMLMIVTLMTGHILEIWTFSLAMAALTLSPALGSLTGNFDGSLDAWIYYSATNYTSIGCNDISPHGMMRAIAVSEALAGVLMIAWSASFTYLKMEQIWSIRHKKK